MTDDEKIAQLQDSLTKAYAATNDGGQPWTPELVRFLGVSILVFCLLVLVISAYLLRAKDADGLTVMKLFGITLIVCLSAFLMIVGYGQSQLTPIVGLFGAIAGYLLGKEKKET